MKKIVAVMLIIFFLGPHLVISTEHTQPLTNDEKYQLTEDVAKEISYFSKVPSNPNLFHDVEVYKDSNLKIYDKTLHQGDDFLIKRLFINDETVPVFELSDGTYLEASVRNIYDDEVISLTDVNDKLWISSSFTVFDSPFVKGSKTIPSDLTSYSQVSVIQKAETNHGIYYKIPNKGWISEDDLSFQDNRILKVQELLNQKYNKSDYSIYVKQLSTTLTASINPNKQMYSASIAKLAVLYAVQEKIKTGQLKLTDMYKYSDNVNTFDGAYDPSGSGKLPKIPDNNEYSIETLLRAVTQNSDNVATNILGYYVLGAYNSEFYKTLQTISKSSWSVKDRIMSSEIAGNMMEAIYHQNGDIIPYLEATDFDGERISKDIAIPVAHKIGDAYDFKHDVAIVYADSPFIISIFTDKSSYEDITNIANDVYDILK